MVIESLTVILVWFVEQIVPWSALVSLALWWGKNRVSFRPSRLFLLLGLGLMEDIAMVHPLGLTSMLAVSLLTLTWLIARYYQTRQLWWWYGLGVAGELLIAVIDGRGLNGWQVGLQLLCLVVVQWWFVRFGKQGEIYVQT